MKRFKKVLAIFLAVALLLTATYIVIEDNYSNSQVQASDEDDPGDV